MSNSFSQNKKNKELLLKYHTSKDKAIYEELFLSNIRLVYFFINNRMNSYKKTNNELLEEYFSVGCIGLHNAIVNYDIEKIDEVAFNTFAYKCIRNEILRETRMIAKQEDHISLNVKINDDDTELLDFISDDDSEITDYIVEEKVYTEYKKKKISDAISKLDDKSKEILVLAYGFNKETKLTPQQISSKLGVSLLYVIRILSNAKLILRQELLEFKPEYTLKNNIINESSRLNKFYSKYGKEQVDLAIGELSEKSQTVMNLYYGLDGGERLKSSDIANILGYSVTNITSTLYNALNAIEKKMENLKKTFNKNRLTELYLRYGKKRVDDIISELTLFRQSILISFYGMEGRQMTFASLAKNLGCSINSITSALYTSLEYIETMIKNTKIKGSKLNKLPIKQRLSRLYKKYGEEKVDNEISCFSEERKKILIMYYGLYGEKTLTMLEVARKLNSTPSAISRNLQEILTNIETNLAKKRKDKSLELYYKYGKENVMQLLKTLTDRQKFIFTSYYGIDDKVAIPVEKIAQTFMVGKNEIIIELFNLTKKLESNNKKKNK